MSVKSKRKKKMFQKSFSFHLLWILAALIGRPSAAASNSITTQTNLASRGCESKCGNLTVPYPFGIGIGKGCALESPLEINCSTASNPPKAYLARGNMELIEISDTELRVKNRVAFSCYNQSTGLTQSNPIAIDLEGFPLAFSNSNMFTVIGCDDQALLRDFDGRKFAKGCASLCYSKEDVAEGDCSGLGCCQIPVPKGTKSFITAVQDVNNRTGIWDFNPCGYSFVGEATRFHFGGARDLHDESLMNRIENSVPMVFDWAIGNLSCEQVRKSNISSACQQNTVCNNSDSELGGYTCSCREGYEGNPYLSPGCQDIEECKNNPCPHNAICSETPGNYTCSCKPGYYAVDDNTSVCIAENSEFPVIKFSLGNPSLSLSTRQSFLVMSHLTHGPIVTFTLSSREPKHL